MSNDATGGSGGGTATLGRNDGSGEYVGPVPDVRERRRSPRPPRWEGRAGEPLVVVGEILLLGPRVFGMAIRRPYGSTFLSSFAFSTSLLLGLSPSLYVVT